MLWVQVGQEAAASLQTSCVHPGSPMDVLTYGKFVLAAVGQWLECGPRTKGHGSHSQSGHMPRLGAWSQLGAWERQRTDISVPLFLLPFPLSNNKLKNLFKQINGPLRETMASDAITVTS